MQFQSAVFVEFASVTGVLGAGEEVAVDFALSERACVLLVGDLDGVGGGMLTAVLLSRLVRIAGVREVPRRLIVATDRFELPGSPTVGTAVIRRSKGDSALFAAADVGEDDRPVALAAIPAGRTVGLKSLSPVLDPGVDTKPAARNSSARTASVRAKRGRTHSLLPSVAS